MKYLFTILNMLLMNAILKAQEIPLYEVVPGSKPAIEQESAVTTDGILRITHVAVPMMTLYQPAPGKANGTSVIICPGGGYSFLAAGHEGADVAKAFNAWGITAFVLKYRLPDTAIMLEKKFGPLQDAQRAILLVRQHATEWKLDPHKIGIMGFSAGGHLAATASTHFLKSYIENPDSISLRPDFSILIYPVISFTDSLAHLGSRDNLIGHDPAAEDVVFFSNELQTDPMTPPAFLVHARNDDLVQVANSRAYAAALVRCHVNAFLYEFESGGHGFGMHNPTAKVEWMELLRKWLLERHFL